jgi:hypothetical protein
MTSDSTRAQRCEDALYIDKGACNPVAIAGTIHRHMLAMSRDGADHPTITHDPAIRLMLHQLAFLCGVDRMFTEANAYCIEHAGCEVAVEMAKLANA